jgi:hypothetical protein
MKTTFVLPLHLPSLDIFYIPRRTASVSRIVVVTVATATKKPRSDARLTPCFLAQPVCEVTSPALDDAGTHREMQAVVVGVLNGWRSALVSGEICEKGKEKEGEQRTRET